MRVTFDPNKNARNIAERPRSFELVVDLDLDTAVAVEDARQGLRRTATSGDGALRPPASCRGHHDRGDAVRVISFRKANSREIKRYADEKNRSGLSAR